MSDSIKFSPNDPLELVIKNFLAKRYEYRREPAKLIVSSGYRFSMEELDADIAFSLAQGDYLFTFDELMQLGNPKNSLGYSLAHIMVASGNMFTIDQILQLGDEPNNGTFAYGMTLSLLMAKHGYQFTYEDILRLNNPANDFGITLAHLCIHRSVLIGYDSGYSDSLRCVEGEFINLPPNLYRSTPRHFDNPPFTIDQLLQLGNPSDKDGDTVAHMMAKTGHIFTRDELKRLGNQKNIFGETISSIMSKKRRNHYIEAKEYGPVAGSRRTLSYNFYFDGRITLRYICDDDGIDTTIEIFNQEAFAIFINAWKDEFTNWFFYSLGVDHYIFKEKHRGNWDETLKVYREKDKASWLKKLWH